MACRIARSREWAVRCIHEQESWEYSCFLTLTYNNLPENGSLSKIELQNFFKRLRKEIYPQKIKYFACGEYGELHERPHYHAIVFGLKGSDPRIHDSWTSGFIRAGTLTFKSARYVAGYIQKKITGKLSKLHYGILLPPFQLQSQGIGAAWAEKNKESLIKNLSLTINGVPTGLPRYYVKKLKNEFNQETADIKKLLSIVELEEFLSKAGVKKTEEWSYKKALRAKKELELDQKLEQFRPRKF